MKGKGLGGHRYPPRAQGVMGIGHLDSPVCARGDLGPFDRGPAAGGSHRFGLDPVAPLCAWVGLLGLLLLPQGSLSLLALSRDFSSPWICPATL